MMTNPIADELAQLWFVHDVTLEGEPKRTMRGVVPGEPTVVKASISMQTRMVSVAGADGAAQEVVAGGTLNWGVDGPLPKAGQTVILPTVFGEPVKRTIISARRAHSGTDLTPDHVEVIIE